MARRQKKSKRTRLSSDEARKKAAGSSGGGGNWFDLPNGVELWEPEKAGKFKLNILPYEVETESHPDEVSSGVVWWKHPFKIHHGVGADGKSFVCPTSIGQKCPICDEIKVLSKNYDDNEDVIKSLRPQRYVAYNIEHPDDPEKVAIFALSVGKFHNLLEKELEESDDEEIGNFFDVTSSGRTLVVRFSKASYNGRDYLEATKIDFEERDEMDEDEVFEKTVCLDNIFKCPSFEKLNEAFLQEDKATDEDDEEDEEDEDEDEAPATSKRSRKPKSAAKSKSKPAPVEDEDDEDFIYDNIEIDDDEDDEDEPPPKKTARKSKSKPAAKSKSKPAPVEDEDDDLEDWDDEDDEDWDDDEDDEDEPPPKKTVRKSKSKSKPAPVVDDEEDDEDWDDEDEDEDEVPPPKKTTRKSKSKPAPVEDDEDDEDDWDDDEEDEDEAPPPKKTVRKSKPAATAKKRVLKRRK